MARKRKAGVLGYEALFEQPTTEETLELMRDPEIVGYRTKTITAGEYREVEIYPLYRTPKVRRGAKAAVTRKAQQILNARNSAKRVTRLIHENFTPRDLFLTLTYAGRQAPTMDQARRDIVNYIKRVKAWRKKNGLDAIRYLYVIQFEDEGREVRVHHHIIMSAMDRDVAEALWGKGRAKSDRLKPDEKGLAALAAYITRSKRGNKRWCASRNLREPKVTVADHKVSRRMMERMVADCRIAAREIFEAGNPGYAFTECEAKVSDLFPGAHISARLRKRLEVKKARKERCA